MVHMRHPNLLNFLGLCTLPPCLLTGGWGGGGRGARERAAVGGCCAACPTPPLANLHPFLPVFGCRVLRTRLAVRRAAGGWAAA